MPTFISVIKKRKHIVLIIGVILLLPFLLPFLDVLVKLIFNLGEYAGTLIRYIVEKKLCF